MSPQKFEDCEKAGGRIRTKTLSDGRYIHICFPKGGGPGIAGEVKEKLDTSKLKDALKKWKTGGKIE